MTPTQYILAAGGVLVLAWPWLRRAGEWAMARVFADHSPARLAGATFEEAVGNLSKVRHRLIQTGLLGDEQKKSIDTLTLALVAGSDK